MAAIDEAAAGLGTRVTDAPAWPVLRRNLALLALGGGDPVAALQHAAPTGRRPQPRQHGIRLTNREPLLGHVSINGIPQIRIQLKLQCPPTNRPHTRKAGRHDLMRVIG